MEIMSDKSSLSAGELIRATLLEDAEICATTTRIFPVKAEDTTLPYILYRRAELEASPQKSGKPGCEKLQIELECCSQGYAEGLKLAETVRSALDFVSTENDGLQMRACHLSNASEEYQGDIFMQKLIFTIKI